MRKFSSQGLQLLAVSEESQSEDEEAGEHEQPARRVHFRLVPKQPAAILGGLMLLALTIGAAALVISSPPSRPHEHEVRSPKEDTAVRGLNARRLLESRELAGIAADQIIEESNGALTDGDHDRVTDFAHARLGNISSMLFHRSPVLARRLDAFELSKPQEDAVLRVVSHMSDHRVQNVGLYLSKVVHEFVTQPVEKDSANMQLQDHIVQRLQPRLAEMRQLRDEVMAPELRRQTAGGPSLDVAMNANNLRVVRTFSNKWKFEMDVSRPEFSKEGRRLERKLSELDLQRGIASGLAEEATVALQQMSTLLGMFGIDVEVPSWISTLGDEGDFLSQLLHCGMQGLESSDASALIRCPMKLASAGVDVLASIP